MLFVISIFMPQATLSAMITASELVGISSADESCGKHGTVRDASTFSQSSVSGGSKLTVR